MRLKKILSLLVAMTMLLSCVGITAMAEGEVPAEGYTLVIYNADGTEGTTIDGTKSASDFCLRSAIADARVFADNAFLFGLTTPCTYEVTMHEDSYEDESFEIGSDVTVIGNGYKIICAEGVVVTVADGATVGAEIVGSEPVIEAVAEIDGVGYATLADAIAAAVAGDTITLVADIALENKVTVPADKEITLDLNGYVIDGTDKVRIAIASYGDLTVKDSSDAKTGAIKAGIGTAGNTINVCGGSFVLESGNIYSLNNAFLIDEKAANVTINGGTITAEPNTNKSAAFYISSTSETVLTINDGTIIGDNGILLWDNTTVNINGGSIDAKGRVAIQGNGSNDNTDINISGGEISGYYSAIYHPQGGTLDITGGTLTGWTGVVVKGGNINISGGEIAGTGEATAYYPVSSGYVDTGDGLYVEHYDNSANSENYGTPTVSVTGGTFTSVNAKAIASYANSNNNVEPLANFVTGGKLTSAPDGVAEGYAALPDLSGYYIVGAAPTATVNNLGMQTVPAGDYGVWDGSSYTSTSTEDMPLSFVMQFIADQDGADMATSPYADWYADFVITFDGLENGSFVADGCYLAGYYGDFGWVKVPVDGMTITEGTRYPVMLGVGLGQKYDYVCSGVQDFQCALYITPELLAANPNLTVNLELAVVDNMKGQKAAEEALVNNENIYEVVDYDYVADDFVVNYVAAIGEDKYTSLEDAFAAAVDGDVITLLENLEISGATDGIIKIQDKNVTFDLNGNKITVTDNAAGSDSRANFSLFYIDGKTDATAESLTLKDSVGTGSIELTATNDRSWNASSSIVHNRGGVLNIESGSYIHNGGTAMAYVVDNSANSYGDATTTVNGGNLTSKYIAIRNRMDTYGANGGGNGIAALVINDGEISGKYAVWGQVASAGVKGSIEINGGTFKAAEGKDAVIVDEDSTGEITTEIKGGKFSSEVEAAEGYAALPDLNGYYIVGAAPTATVNNLGMQTVPAGDYGVWDGSSYTSTSTEDMPLSFVMQFIADQDGADMATSPYADWYADFVITFDGLENGSFVADGCYLAGYYGDFGWVKVPVDGMTITEGTRYPVMLGVGLGQKYDYVCSGVQDFQCALYITPELLAANPNLTVNLELAVVDNMKGQKAAEEALVNNENIYEVVDYDYVADDFVVNYVAAIGEDKYTSLADAIAAAEAGDTVTLLGDIALTEGVTVPADKKITLDLAGKTITGTPEEAKAFAVITNKGDLTITGEGTIVCDHQLAGSTSYAVNTIVNSGTLTVENGVIENKSTASNQIGYAIDNNSTAGNAVVTVNGGEIKVSGSNYYDGIRQFANSTTLENSVTVAGGSVSSIWMQNPSDGASDRNTKDVKGSIAVTGGTVGAIYLEPSAAFTASVTGGEIGSLSAFETAEGRDLAGFVSGGTFTSKPDDAYAVDGYEFTANTEGKYEVTAKAELFDFSGATVTLGNAMEISFFVKQEYIIGEDYYAIVEHDLPDGTTTEKKYEFAEWEARRLSGVDYYAINYTDLSAKQIADELRVTIYKGDGTQASNIRNDGLSAYAYRTLASTKDSELRTVLVDMLNYGAAAQVQFNYNTENLANADADSYQQYATPDISHIKDERVPGENFVGTTLTLENNIQLTGYFKNLTSDMYAVATFTDHYGNDKKLEVSGSDFVKYNSTTYGVCVDNLVVADAAQLVTITVYNSDGTVYGTLVDSINSYVARSINDGEIYSAIAKFALSAYNTLH